MSVTATTTTTALQKDMMMMSVQHAPNEPSLINYEEDAFGTGVSAILNPSDELFCPISHTIMSEPVIAADGRTYEKELITQWLREHNGTSPFTRENIGTNTIENVHIKNEIQRFFTTLKSLESDHCAFQYHLSNDVFLPCSMLVEFQHAVSKNDLNTVKTLYDNDIRLLLYSPEMLNDFVNHNISSLVRANNFSSKSLISYSLNGYELCCKIGSLEMIEDMYNFLSRSSLNRPLPPLANETNIERTSLNKALWSECKKEHVDIHTLSKLMNFGAQPHKLDASGRSSLYIFLSCHDNVEAFKILFETHCTVLIREKCHQNEYLLYSAAKFNRYNIVRYLMERHADLIDLSLQHGPNNESPLHAVVRNSNEELLTFFLSQRNVGVDYLDSFNRSPFMLSCKLGFFGVTKLLYDKGAQLDLCDHDGDTGLHYAASRNWSPIIELLICNGADVNARNKRGLSPYNVASYETTKSLIQYLTAKQLSFAFKRVRVIEDENSFLKSQLLSMLERIEKLERQQTPQQ